MLPRKSDRIIPQPAHGRLVILLTGTPKAGGVVVRDRLVRILSETPVIIQGVQVPTPTISGVATYPDDGAGIRELIGHAWGIVEEKRRSHG